MKYLDFDLSFERSDDRYVARVLNSPGGQASATFSPPFSDLEVENFLLRVGRSRRTVRRIESPELVFAKLFGGKLFSEVFAGEVHTCLRNSLDDAARQNVGLRLRLHLAGAPALADLPWEFLYNATLNRFLGLSIETPVVRYLELPERIRPVAVKPPLRVLMMISSPTDYPRLDVEREADKMREALAELEQRGVVMVERLEDATLSELQRRLRQREYHIFHFVGHGGFDEQAQDGILVLEDQEERGRRVSAQFIGTLLHDHRPLRLAILNACEGARASRADPFAGTAQTLVQQGVPAVIAMQFEVTDDAAICFTREFYSAIAGGYPVDAALGESRKAIFADVSEIEWGTPVLYMRAPDGRIFDVEPVAGVEHAPPPIDALLADARVSESAGDIHAAIEKLNRVLALEPKHPEASARLREISRQRQLANQYGAGRAAADDGRWPEAVDIFKRLHAMDRTYRDVESQLASAQQALSRSTEDDARRRRATDLRRAASGAMAKERWDEAVERWQMLLAEKPDDALARSQLAESRKQQDLARSYARARELADRQRWQDAIAELRQIQKEAPGYKDVSTLVANAEQALSRAAAAESAASPRTKRSAVETQMPPASVSQPRAAPAVSIRPAQSSGRAKWFVIGGALGGVVALVVTLLLVAVIIIALKDQSGPAAPASDGPPPVAPSGLTTDVSTARPKDSAGRVAADPVSTRPPLDPNAMFPASREARAELEAVVRRASDTSRIAYLTLNPQLLPNVYAGRLLANQAEQLQTLLVAGTAGVINVSRQDFQSVVLSGDERRAEVTVTERWSMNFIRQGLCVTHIHDHDVTQTLKLERGGQGWLIYDSNSYGEPEFAPCH